MSLDTELTKAFVKIAERFEEYDNIIDQFLSAAKITNQSILLLNDKIINLEKENELLKKQVNKLTKDVHLVFDDYK